MRGVIAAGHELTAQAAEMVLREGGNAFDAIVAAHFAACAAEPVLASLGGGGFLLAKPAGERPLVFDFFVHTPYTKRAPDAIDAREIWIDFGTARQTFHIGRGTCATPGSVKGAFEIQRRLCTMPMRELCAPAIRYAREGVRMNALLAYIAGVVHPIYAGGEAARAIYGGSGPEARLVEGDVVRQPALADTLEALAVEGDDLFYRGEIAQLVARECEHGGLLTRADFERYAVELRAPLITDYRDVSIMTNPPPSSGGILIAFALKLLNGLRLRNHPFGSARHLRLLANVMDATQKARVEALLPDGYLDDRRLLDGRYLELYRRQILGHPRASRGTTHISVIDGRGNVATMSISNGEGCGEIVPGTGIMLNNMLGEDDLSPHGLQAWRAGLRMSSMMAPSLVLRPNGDLIATGSGGSNRIRTAILQVLSNLIDFDMDVEPAVCSPRIHLEGSRLSLEGGLDVEKLDPLLAAFPEHETWPELNLFFGGAHTVMRSGREFRGAGDPRRGGVVRIVA
ncbi:MAG: gamma-glutamyltransferase family protein [Gammaproteobacteria bacterium]